MAIKEVIKSFFTEAQTLRLRKNYNRFNSFIYSNNLNKLAIIWRTDKWGSHWYTQHYDSHFKSIRNKKLKIFEVGVGGYEKPNQGGNSLRMWKQYFRRSEIYAIDIYDKKALEENRIKIFQGDQTDETLLNEISLNNGPFDLIIDDGSHLNEHIIKTFEILFPLLKDNGIYVIEDLETSYWKDYGGDSDDLVHSQTAINYLKKMIDGLNHKEMIKPDIKPSYFDLNIISLHFYHNMVFIYKGLNGEKSVNIIENKHHRTESI